MLAAPKLCNCKAAIKSVAGAASPKSQSQPSHQVSSWSQRHDEPDCFKMRRSGFKIRRSGLPDLRSGSYSGHPSRYNDPDCRILTDRLRYGDPVCRFLEPPSKMSRSGLPYLDFAFDASSDARQSDLWGLPPEWRSGLPYLEGSPNLAIQMPR